MTTPVFTVRASDSAGNETVATKTFQVAGSGETIFPINVPTNGTDAAAALNAALAALPNGTPQNRTIGLLPNGTITLLGALSPTIGLYMVNKQWVELRGQNTILHWPDYGPWSPNGRQERRHFVLVGCSNVTLRGVHVAGGHTQRHESNSAVAKYVPDKAFQHGFQLSSCSKFGIFDCSAQEISGDGLYLNTVDDLVVDGFRVQFNGRQGIAGIDGQRWLLDHVNVVGCTRGSIDWEPIGSIGSRLRWVADVEIRNSYLSGWFGAIFHRCSNQWLHHNQIGGGIRLSDATDELRQLRTMRLEDNDFGVWWVETKDWPVVHANGFKSLTVTRNSVDRHPTNPASVGSPLVRVNDPLLNGATLTVRDNLASGFKTALAPAGSFGPGTLDTLVANNTWDVGNNDRGSGVIEEEPAWLASRLGGG